MREKTYGVCPGGPRINPVLNGVSKVSVYDDNSWDSSDKGQFVVGDADGVSRLTGVGAAVDELGVVIGGWFLTVDLIGIGMNDLEFVC